MKKVTAKDIIALRYDLGMTGEQFGKLFGFGNAAKIRISEIENETQPISRHVEVIYRLLVFIKRHGLIERFISG